VRQRYDVIVLDCPPNLSLVGVNALVAADALIVPVTPQHLAVEGLVSLLASVETVRLRLSGRNHLLGILLTMVDPTTAAGLRRETASREIRRARVSHGNRIEPRAREAPTGARTIFQHAPRSRAADAFIASRRKSSNAFADSHLTSCPAFGTEQSMDRLDFVWLSLK
jgi:chromosome partitioning protein